MVRRAVHPRSIPQRGRRRVLTPLVAASILAAALPARLGRAAPPPSSEVLRATDLYRSAEAAMQDGRFDDALRDYGAAYELTKDPALFFKIARANQRAGKCEVALSYYARYLRDGSPTAQFASLTRQHIAACGGAASAPPPGDAAPPPEPAISPPADPPAGPPAPAPGLPSEPVPASPVAPPAAPPPAPRSRHTAAWIVTGGAIALTVLGGVLAAAARSSENDVRDLYVGVAGQVPAFDATTQRRYDELVDQGHSYQHLSWAAFGLAGGAAAGAAALFLFAGDPEVDRRARVTPVVTPQTAGVAIAF
jgi:tetratricopeptide (TPR) repeat protein